MAHAPRLGWEGCRTARTIDRLSSRTIQSEVRDERSLLPPRPHGAGHRRLARHRPHDRRRLPRRRARAVYISSRKAEACDATAAELVVARAPASRCRRTSRPSRASTRSPQPFGAREPTLDILVNNAGAAWGETFDTFPEKGWDKVVDLNLKTPFFLTQALHEPLRKAASAERPAKVINIASIDGISVNPQETYSYAASKAGLIQLTRRMALRLAQDNIVVSAIAPGRLRVGDEPRWRATTRDEVAQRIPAGRIGARRRHGRRGDLPGFARRRLRRRLDPGRRRRRDASPAELERSIPCPRDGQFHCIFVRRRTRSGHARRAVRVLPHR